MADATKEKPVFLRSPKQHKFEPGDPPMDIERLRAYHEQYKAGKIVDPKVTTFAQQLLQRCGHLVLDGVQYRYENGVIQGIPVEFLGVERERLARGIDKLVIENA